MNVLSENPFITADEIIKGTYQYKGPGSSKKKKKKVQTTADKIIEGNYKYEGFGSKASTSSNKNSLLDIINSNITKDIERFKPNNNKSFVKTF